MFTMNEKIILLLKKSKVDTMKLTVKGVGGGVNL